MYTFEGIDSEAVERLANIASAETMTSLGESIARHGRKDVAELALRHAVEMGSTSALVELAVAARIDGRIDDAIHWANEAIQNGEVGSYITLGNAFADQGRISEAESAYRQAAVAGCVEAFANLGSLAAESGDSANAERLYREGADAGDALARRDLGVHLMELGRLNEAVALLAEVARDDYEAWFDLGNAQAQIGDHRGAAGSYGQGAVLGDDRCHLALADVLADDLGDHDAAEAQYQAAIRLGDELAYLNYGLFLLGDNRTEQAKHYLGIAACLGQGAAWHELATLARLAGDSERADRLLLQAVAMGDEAARQELPQPPRADPAR